MVLLVGEDLEVVLAVVEVHLRHLKQMFQIVNQDLKRAKKVAAVSLAL